MVSDDLIQRAQRLAEEGRNTLQGLVGPPPEARMRFRDTYLRWHAEVERILEQAGVDRRELEQLQNPRHRDIVRDSIPDDQLYREVSVERDLRLRLLDGVSQMDDRPDEQTSAEVLEGGIGKYKLYRNQILGSGASIVYAGESLDGQLVAIKRVEVRTDSTSRWYGDMRLAEREIEAAQQLPAAAAACLMPIIDHISRDGELFLVMPRAERSLDDLLSSGRRLDELEVRDLLLRGADALQVLAEHGIIHRDIKPKNVYWWRGGWVLGDLGIAHLDGVTATYTWAGTGTHAYWAPELFGLQAPATVRSDLYALGCTAVEALTGTPLFAGTDLARQHREEQPKLPSITDPLLERVLVMLLMKDPEGRPTDARHLKDLLSPKAELSDDQVILQRLAARAGHKAAAADQAAARFAGIEESRRAALVALQRVWSELVAHASAAVADVESEIVDGGWTLRAADGRLLVKVAEPADGRSSALQLGLVRVAHLDGDQSDIANLVCTATDTGSRWELLTVEHNSISSYKPPLSRPLSQRAGALSLSELEKVVDLPQQSGPPRIIITRSDLTVRDLFGRFTRELGAMAGEQP